MEITNTMRNVMLTLSHKNDFDWDKTYADIKNKERVSEEQIKEALEYLNSMKGTFITILDEDYPEYLKMTSKPPFVIIMCGKAY